MTNVPLQPEIQLTQSHKNLCFKFEYNITKN